MIWRRVMLALPTTENVPDRVIDRVGRLVRGLQGELKLFHCFFDSQLVHGGLPSHIF